MPRRRYLAVSATFAAVTTLAACGGSDSDGGGDATAAATKESAKLCLHQTSSAPTGVAVVEGYEKVIDASGRDYTVEVKNSEGDAAAIQAITEQFLKSGCDIITPTGSQIALGYVKREKDVPIVFGSVSAPYKLGIVDSETDPGRNVTGIGTPIPIAQELDLLKQIMPDVKKVGMIYGAADLSGQLSAEMGQEHYGEIGVEGKQIGVANSSEIRDAAQSLVKNGVEALQVGCDSISAQGISAMIKVGAAADVPVFGCSDIGMDEGKLFAGGYRYDEVGEETAKLALKVLDGEDPGSIPVTDHPIAGFYLNEGTAKKLGLEFPEDVIAQSPGITKAG